MAEIPLTPKERQALKARAHALKPVVLLGAAGLTPSVVKEIDRALAAHELIKVKVPGDDRAEREAMFTSLTETLSAARVQAIGKLLVLFRPAPDDEPVPTRTDARNAMKNKSHSRQPREAEARTKGSKPSRTTPLRNEVERIHRGAAPRRDPGEAHRAAGRRNAPKRKRS